ncbi:MAG: hypothetical protein ABIH59_03490 [archaeon]
MKTALLVKGGPLILENSDKFYRDIHEDVGIMTKVASAQGYNLISVVPLDQMFDEITRMSSPDDFLFYFVGHANSKVLGRRNYPFEKFFGEVDKNYSGRKLIVLDCCTQDLLNREDINFPFNSRVCSAYKVYSKPSLAKLFHDGVFSWRKDLEQIDVNFFEDQKHYWVKVRDTSLTTLGDNGNG